MGTSFESDYSARRCQKSLGGSPVNRRPTFYRRAGNVGPISRYAVRGLEQRGIHLNGNIRFPMQVTEQDLGRANLIIALKEAEHRRMLAVQFPAWLDRVEYWHVHDLDCAEPKDALDQLEREVVPLSSRLLTARETVEDHRE